MLYQNSDILSNDELSENPGSLYSERALVRSNLDSREPSSEQVQRTALALDSPDLDISFDVSGSAVDRLNQSDVSLPIPTTDDSPVQPSVPSFRALDEADPGGDSIETAEFVPLGFGLLDSSSLEINGSLEAPPPFPDPTPFTQTEDDDAIPFANVTGLAPGESVIASGFIGDGQNGSAGTGTGDVDFYAVTADVGETITIETTTEDPLDGLDTFIEIFDSDGTFLDFSDSSAFGSAPSFDAELTFTPAEADTYFIAVGDANTFINDPLTPGSGSGVGEEGEYDITIGLDIESALDLDQDFFEVELNAGDIIGANVTGGAGSVTLLDPDGDVVIGSDFDAAGFSSEDASFPVGGNASFSYVIDTAGTYTIDAESGEGGDYTLDLEVFRPTLEQAEPGTVQTLFLDFDGATFNPNEVYAFGIDEDVTTSDLASSLPNFGLTADDEDAVIDAIVASVTENIEEDISAFGNNPNFDIEILNSRDHADPFGDPNVSRVVIGGTIDEIGIDTIGIASQIDLGNFSTADEAIVLLDILSDSDPDSALSINNIPLAPETSIIDPIGTVVGAIASHEAGHLFGNAHTTDTDSSTVNIQDSGNSGNLFEAGVGDDGIFGTDDDIDVDFTDGDVFEPAEGFIGVANSLNSIAFGLSTPVDIDAEAEVEATVVGDIFAVNDIATEADDNLILAERRDIIFLNDPGQVVRGVGDVAQVTSQAVEVLASDINQVAVRAGDGDDLVDASALLTSTNILGGRGNDSLTGSAANDVLVGGFGDDQLDGGAGDDTIVTGIGDDTIVLRAGDGTDTVLGFRDGSSSFLLDGGLTFDDLSFQQGSGGRTNIAVDDTDEVLTTLVGVQASSLDSSDFLDSVIT